jgi:ABC-type multidrug transport system fused ATPase/permease subunit
MRTSNISARAERSSSTRGAIRAKAGDQPAKPKLSEAWPQVWRLIRPRRWLLLLGFLLMLVNRFCGLALPASSKFFIDDVLYKRQSSRLLPLIAVVLTATLIQALTSFALTQLLAKAAQRMIADLRRQVQAHIGRLSVSFYDANRTGTLVSRIMTDVEGVRNLIGTGLVDFIGGLITAIISFVVLLRISLVLTLLVFATVLAFAGILDNVMRSLTMTSVLSMVSTGVIGLMGSLVMLLGGGQVLHNRITPGGYVQYTMFLAFMIAPILQAVSVGTQLTEAVAGLDRTSEILGERQEYEEPGRVIDLPTVRGDVRFNDVRFAYEPDKPVLHGVSFHAEPGSVTALVGSSGSGKSTIISLVCAFHAPGSGSILVDGVDLSTVKLDSYRQQLGVVLQESFLFDGSIRDNVMFSRPDATEEQFLHACAIARVDEFAERFPDAYETIVGERGVKLSGGQRQRLSIARAILAEPRVLILDEATSSLDSESEAMIQHGLSFLMQGRTTFVIAHRLSTIRRADQILVVEAGEIVEHGTHESLYALGGRYYDLYTRQHGLESNRFLAPGEGDTAGETEMEPA